MDPKSSKVSDPVWGDLHVLVIPEARDGSWTREWEPLRLSEEAQTVVNQLPRIPKGIMDSALHGDAGDLVKTSGRPPRGQRFKFLLQPCSMRSSCVTASSKCVVSADHPICWSAEIEDVTVQSLVNRIVHQWKDGGFVLIVVDDGSGFTLI